MSDLRRSIYRSSILPEPNRPSPGIEQPSAP